MYWGAMYFPQFLIGMVMASTAVAIWVYTATASVWLSLAWTVAAAVLLQFGYFVLTLRLIYKKNALDETDASKDGASEAPVIPFQRQGGDSLPL
jgi:exopolysaccharide production repressor protein